MAWNHKYKNMLDRAYEKLPEEIREEARFEVPKVNSERQGNKTIIKSFPQLAKKVNRNKEHLMKFLLGELATTGKEEDGRAIFMGSFTKKQIQDKFEKYIKEFVLCDQCGKPDTKIKKEKGLAFKVCEACGAKSSVKSIK